MSKNGDIFQFMHWYININNYLIIRETIWNDDQK